MKKFRWERKNLNIIDWIKSMLLMLYTEHKVVIVLNSVWTKTKAKELMIIFFEKYYKNENIQNIYGNSCTWYSYTCMYLYLSYSKHVAFWVMDMRDLLRPTSANKLMSFKSKELHCFIFCGQSLTILLLNYSWYLRIGLLFLCKNFQHGLWL